MSEEVIRVILPDGSQKEVPVGSTVGDVAAAIGRRLAKAAVAGKVNGKLVDLSTTVQYGDQVEIVTVDSSEGLEVLRHSTAHVMAQAVKRLYPEAKLAIGPAIENGFYYDFDLPETLSSEDLVAIEDEMKKIVQEDLPFERQELSREEAIKFFTEQGEEYKRELIEDLEDETVSIYRQGEFVDLCRGPHVPSTKALKAFKLQNVAGAYWRGDSRRPMLQRIYGLAFARKDELDEHLRLLEEAAKRDHRKLGKELDLFSLRDEGPGFPFIHPKGMILWNSLLDFWRETHRKRGYAEVKTPIILNEKLWRQSGHWDHYQENMYFTQIDGENYAIKPMNCPGSMLLYGRKVHSYRDLPLRVAELGLVHRHELSGALHGLMRVRSFTQDDAHIFMLPEQIQEEIEGVIDLIDYVYSTFGFNYHVELSTKPEKAMGSDEIWEMATESLESALKARGLPYQVNEGDGAFYGPKIDFHLEDAIGRTWQCGTIQLDFLMPERFDLTYVGADNEKHRPVMIHRVVFGSIERFMAILVEHFAGAFPAWLAPVQVQVIPVGEKFNAYARKVASELEEAGVRTEVDDRDEKVSYKIREAQLQKIPYMLIVGEREEKSGTVSLRSRTNGDQGSLSLAEFKDGVTKEIKKRALDLTW
ncbi:MAG: threonine--tRNA ligase [Firmicutes bacterium]|nr:threonine--tRNA ligase [Bacillota bacterium]